MNKKIKVILSVILVGLVAVGGWKYMDYKGYCETHYPANTIINGMDCCGKTVSQAEDLLTDKWNDQVFRVVENGLTIAELKDMNFNYDIKDQLQEIMDNGHKLPIYTTVFKKNENLTVAMNPKKWTDSFNTQIDNLPIYDQENPVTTTDAYVDLSNTDFKIVPEVYGNNIDKKMLKKAITSALAADNWSLVFSESEFYTQPALKTDSEEILERQEYCKKYLSHKITYTFGSDTYTLSPTEMDALIMLNKKGEVRVRSQAADDFVAKLAGTYNTVNTNRAFKSTARGTVIIDGGTYGYIISQAGEKKQLISDLKALKDVTREPVYAQSGWGWENNGFGTTYIEVDLGSQQLWYYQGGRLVMTCPFVSGCIATKNPTVTGAFSIVYMATDVTLKGGDKKKGTDYETHVDYWMPFYGDYGLHDADWRSAFGGDIYITGGSHGCVNMPPAMAKQLYETASSGTPVIVFN